MRGQTLHKTDIKINEKKGINGRENTKKLTEKNVVNYLRNQYLRNIGNKINEAE